MDNFDLDSFDSSVSGTATTGSHELEELKRINERRDFWEGRGDIDPRSWANKDVIELLGSLLTDPDNTEKYNFLAMGDYKKHSFPKSSRVSLLLMYKLMYIEEKTGEDFNSLVSSIIEQRYQDIRATDKE